MEKEIEAFLAAGGKITKCPPSNKRPEQRKGPIYSKSRARSGCWLPPARDLNFDYS